MPDALLAQIEEAATLDQPEELPVIVVQIVLTVHYRRI